MYTNNTPLPGPQSNAADNNKMMLYERPPKSHITGFLVVFFISLVILAACFLKIKDFINWFPPLFILFLSFMYSFSEVHKSKLTKPSEYLYPLYILLSISLTIITFTFGMHSDVFSVYDSDPVDATFDRYKWFETKEVLDFPLSQLRHKDHAVPDTIDFEGFNNKKPVANIIILDGTASVIDSATEKIKSVIFEKISANFNANNDYYTTAELVPPFLFGGFYEKAQRDSGEEDEMGCWLYTGLGANPLRPLSKTDHLIIKSKDLLPTNSTYVTDYFAFIKSLRVLPAGSKKPGAVGNKKSVKKINGQTTSFFQLWGLIKDRILKNKDLRKKDVNLFIVSDFLNSDVNEPTPDFSERSQIKNLKLYVLKGKDHADPDNRRAEELIAKMTKKFNNLHEVIAVDFKNITDIPAFYDRLWASNLPVTDERTTKSIQFYFPYKDFTSNHSAEAKIILKDRNPDDSDSSGFSVKVSDADIQNTPFKIIYNTKADTAKKVAFSDEVFKIPKSSGELTISIPSASFYKDDCLLVDAASKVSNTRDVRSISFKPLLPDTTSFYIFIFYTIFVVSISLVLILPNLFVLVLIPKQKVKCLSRRSSSALAPPVAAGLAFLLYYIYIVSNSKVDSLITYFFIVFGSILVIVLPNYYLDIKNIRKKTQMEENYKFEPWGRVGRGKLIRGFDQVIIFILKPTNL